MSLSYGCCFHDCDCHEADVVDVSNGVRYCGDGCCVVKSRTIYDEHYCYFYDDDISLPMMTWEESNSTMESKVH